MGRRRKKSSGQSAGGGAGPPSILNRKARHNYHIIESMEAGIALTGAEVKSIREGKISLKDSYGKIKNDEVWLIGCHINPYSNLNTFDPYNPLRERKLLLHKKQIKKLAEATHEKGLTLLPLKLYFKRGIVKIELGIGKGKKLYDKRYDIKKRDSEREIERAMKK